LTFGKKMMTKLLLGVLMLAIVPQLPAFDVDGFRSGMTFEEVKAVVAQRTYSKVFEKDTSILLTGPGPSDFASLAFFKNRLTIYQKDISPEFKRFVEVVGHFREKFGRPLDAFGQSADPLSNYSTDVIRFIWRVGADDLEVSYSSRQLSVIYTERKKEPNQSLEPTPTAVTSPAAQEPRRP
jgi:hypothetical protein